LQLKRYARGAPMIPAATQSRTKTGFRKELLPYPQRKGTRGSLAEIRKLAMIRFCKAQ
jgi:hypothetical protein